MGRRLFVSVVMVFILTGMALAADQGANSPEEQEKQFQQQMQMMAPFFGQMMKTMMETELNVLASPETAEKLASFTRNYYDALIRKGFSKDEALKIATSVGFPSLPTMQQ